MGALRDKAKAEQAQAELEHRQRREKEERERRRKHEERAGPAAKFLSEWSGETVRPHELHAVEGGRGPANYNLEIDGFKLRVEVIGKPPGEKHTFVIHQRNDDESESRQVDKPADLLMDWPVPA